MNKALLVVSIALSAGVMSGCLRTYGPEPETVPWVDLSRYTGVWHEIASNPVFFNRNLVAVTAEYQPVNETTVSVLNTGYVGSPDGRKRTISGTATVVEPETNSKLQVRFDPFPNRLFPGNYWIVLLDDEANENSGPYEYAVVTDTRQFTLFVLAREPAIPEALYKQIKAELEERRINIERLHVTGELL